MLQAALLAASVVAGRLDEPEAFGRSGRRSAGDGNAGCGPSDLGAVPETVLAPPEVGPEGRTGWRVPAGDVDALAEALNATQSWRHRARCPREARAPACRTPFPRSR